MKILVLNYEFPPVGCGGASVSYEMSRVLVNKGHDVTVVTMNYKDLPYYEVREGIKIYRVKCLRKRRDACKPFEQFTYLISCAKFLRQHLKANTYDINHTHFVFPTGVISLWLKWKYNLDYVITAHGSDVPGHNPKFDKMFLVLKPIWKGIVRKAKYIVSPSIHLLDLIKDNEPLSNYRFIANGIYTQDYYSSKKNDEILVLCRLQKSKGVQNVIKAFAKVNKKNWILRIVGDGPYRRELEDMVQKLSLAESVIFEGWVENKSEKHLELLSKAKIYISASQFENCPISVLEALCSGSYPLLSNISAHSNYVSNDHLFEVNNVKDLSDKLQTLILEDTIDYKVDKKQYDWDLLIDEYIKLFQE